MVLQGQNKNMLKEWKNKQTELTSGQGAESRIQIRRDIPTSKTQIVPTRQPVQD